MRITTFLTAHDHPRMYRGVVSEADAASRIRTAHVAAFDLDREPTLAVLDEVFAITNDAPGMTPEQTSAACDYRYGGETRSLSVGDLVHVEGLGLYSVEPTSWRKFDHRLTIATATRRVQETA